METDTKTSAHAVSQGATMSATTGTIAFGTAFLALAAGLAVFAAVRQKPGEVGPYLVTSTMTTTLSTLSVPDEVRSSDSLTITSAKKTTVAMTSTTTAESPLLPSSEQVMVIQPVRMTAPNNRRVTIQRNGRRLSSTAKVSTRVKSTRRTTTTTSTTTTTTAPSPSYSQEEFLDYDEQLATANQHVGNDFESGADITHLLHNARRMYLTTPRNLNPFRIRSLGARHVPAEPWPSTGRSSSSSLSSSSASSLTPSRATTAHPALETISRRRPMQTSLMTNVLNDAISYPTSMSSLSSSSRTLSPTKTSSHSSSSFANSRRSLTTDSHDISKATMAMQQIFADEPPAGHDIPHLPSGDDGNIGPSTPFVLTLFTGGLTTGDTRSPINSSTFGTPTAGLASAVTKSSPTTAALLQPSDRFRISSSNSIDDDPSDVSLLRLSHRRSVVPPSNSQWTSVIKSEENEPSSGHQKNVSAVASKSATSLVAVIALLLFVAVLLTVALFIQRRHFIARLRTVGHCSVLPLPIGLPTTAASSTIVEVSQSNNCDVSSTASTSSHSPTNSPPSAPKSHHQFSSFRYVDNNNNNNNNNNNRNSNHPRNAFFIGTSNKSNSASSSSIMQPVSGNPAMLASVLVGTAIEEDCNNSNMTRHVRSSSLETNNIDGTLRFSSTAYTMPLHHY